MRPTRGCFFVAFTAKITLSNKAGFFHRANCAWCARSLVGGSHFSRARYLPEQSLTFRATFISHAAEQRVKNLVAYMLSYSTLSLAHNSCCAAFLLFSISYTSRDRVRALVNSNYQLTDCTYYTQYIFYVYKNSPFFSSATLNLMPIFIKASVITWP